MQKIARHSTAAAHAPTEGELWAQAALRDLRQAKFAPAAWVTFLRASFARARLRRRQRQREHRELVALAGAGLVAWIGVALAGRPALAALAAGWWLLVLLMLDWHLGMLERPDGRPLHGLGVANRLSLARAAIVPLVVVLPPTALAAVLLAAGASDILDGWIARNRDEVTRLGFSLDPAVDSWVLTVAAVAAARVDRLPLWIALLVAARYVLPWVLVAASYFARAEAPPTDTYVSGRWPGVVVLCGIALSALGVPGAAPLVLAGAVGGILTFALTIAAALRNSVASVDTEAVP